MQMQIIIEKFLRSEQSRILKLKPLDKLLMFFLASYMGNKNDCFPSFTTLMKDLGISDRSSLSEAFKNLDYKNIIKIKKECGKKNHYQFNLDFIPVWNPDGCSLDSLRVPVCKPDSNNITNNINNNRRSANKTQELKPKANLASVDNQSTSFKKIQEKRSRPPKEWKESLKSVKQKAKFK